MEVLNIADVSIPYRYKQNQKVYRSIRNFTVFQSPIGTNKTYILDIFPSLRNRFQSPIGTNKTSVFLKLRKWSYGSFNPLQVQTKRRDGSRWSLSKLIVSIPYRYKQNAMIMSYKKMLCIRFNPLQVQTKLMRIFGVSERTVQFQSPIGTNKT